MNYAFSVRKFVEANDIFFREVHRFVYRQGIVKSDITNTFSELHQQSSLSNVILKIPCTAI